MVYATDSTYLPNDMNSTFLRRCVLGLSFGLALSSIRAADVPFFHERDPLINSDKWGPFHQMPRVNAVDYAWRYHDRYYYYFQSGNQLVRDPAYVGVLQVSLRSRGYYCGPIDGVMSDDVRDAIARVQKNHWQRVTGTLTVPVRRVLSLP
jgi:hypothetical protein